MAAKRKRIVITGRCGGVGFRLFVQQAAAEFHLGGWLRLSDTGAEIELEGDAEAIDRFLRRVSESPPGSATIDGIRAETVTPTGEAGFRALAPATDEKRRAIHLPPIEIGIESPRILAVGAELEYAACYAEGRRIVFSPVLGAVQGPDTLPRFRETIEEFARTSGDGIEMIACDLHPDYHSTRWASGRTDTKIAPVQHHEAHVAACMADADLWEDVIGVVLDGAGLGTDGRIWGGEFLVGSPREFRRMAHVRTVALPGAERAAREPWRMAYSWMDAATGDGFRKMKLGVHERVHPAKYQLLMEAIRRNINCPPTSCVERLLDGMASLLDLRDLSMTEGQAAEELSGRYAGQPAPPYPLTTTVTDDRTVVLDPAESVLALLHDVVEGVSRATIIARLFETLAFLVYTGCDHIRARTGLKTVALTGRVFRNDALVRRTRELLEGGEFRVVTHERLSAGDSSVCVGQAVIAAARRERYSAPVPPRPPDGVLL